MNLKIYKFNFIFYLFILSFLICFDAYSAVKPFFTPSIECEQNIFKLINESNDNIVIAIYSLTNENITQALKDAFDRKVKIRILSDRVQAGNKASKIIELKNYKLNVRVNSKHKIEHNKFAVFDDKKIITGSYNWTESASKANSENCLVITRNKTAVDAYKSRFEYLWKVNTKKKSDEWFDKKQLSQSDSV